jgi:phage tail-like protein
MALFPANMTRFDPYKAYRFLVYFDSAPTTPVAAVSKFGALKRSSDVIEYKEAGNGLIRKGLGRTKYEPVTLERGLSQDPAFQAWADYAQKLTSGAPSSSLKNLRQNVLIVLLNEAAQPVIRYRLYRCWVSEYQAMPDLDGGGNSVAIEHLKLENEGWERDALPEPSEV